MKRGVVLAVGAVALLAGAALAWNAVRVEREFRTLVADGDRALADGQTFAAIEAFSAAIALKDDSMVAYLKRGDGYRRRGELAAALRDVRQAAELDPTAPQPAELLGDVNMAMARHERAAEHYQRFIQLDERAPRVLYKLGLAYYLQGQAVAALDPLRRAIALDERLAEAHYLLGVCLREARLPADAIRALERAIALDAGFAAARGELAAALAATGRARDGIEQLEALAALEPSRPERLVSIGLAYAAAGRREAAVTALARAAERYPGHPQVYTALGRIWLDAAEGGGDTSALAKALEALQPAATRADASSETLAVYGRALFLSGEADAAELVLQQAAARLPVHVPALAYLAEAAERLGHSAIAAHARAQRAALQATTSIAP